MGITIPECMKYYEEGERLLYSFKVAFEEKYQINFFLASGDISETKARRAIIIGKMPLRSGCKGVPKCTCNLLSRIGRRVGTK